MENRTLTISTQSDWQSALRSAGRVAEGVDYQGERLNFEAPADFFGMLTARRWALVQALVGQGKVSIRELARRVGRRRQAGSRRRCRAYRTRVV